MKILFVTVLLAVLLSLLWAPVCLVAWKLSRQGDVTVLRGLRIILPGQLVAVVVLAFLADAIGLKNPAGLIIALVIGVSLLGAGILFLRGRSNSIR